jgi:hypothetical protein
MQALEKLLSPFSLLAINIVIIFAVEFVGGGLYFYDSGWIHGMAVLFVALASARVFSTYSYKDPILRRLLNLSLVALFIFAMSHFAEFLSEGIFKEAEDQSFGDIINLYPSSLLLILAGTEYVLSMIHRRSRLVAKIAPVLSVLFVFLTLFLLYAHNPNFTSPKVNAVMAYLYLATVLLLSVFAIFDLKEIKNIQPLKSFSIVMMWSIACIASTVVISALRGTFPDVIRVSDVQIVYITHFIFYASISLMCIAFSKIKPTGIYAETGKYIETGIYKQK